MRVVVQRVKSASCIVDNKITGSIEQGFMLLVSFTYSDNLEIVKKMAKKISLLRIFDDEQGKMNLSIKDVGGSILSISQFTLYGDALKGNRPSFVNSLPGNLAQPLYDAFNDILKNDFQINVATGVFGAHMYLNPVCDGPVTITLEY